MKLVACNPSREVSHNCRLCKGVFLCILGLYNDIFNFSDHKAFSGRLLVGKEVEKT
jgi:hypothetical protein